MQLAHRAASVAALVAVALTLAVASSVLLSLSIGCSGSGYVSPTVEQGPPPFVGPPSRDAAPSAAASSRVLPPAADVTPLSFHRTRDSNDWVARAFRVQAQPPPGGRVIAVSAGEPPARVRLPPLDLERRGSGVPVDLPVTVAVKTLSEAAREAKGGDLVAVLPGHYEGFTLGDDATSKDERFIVFRALGAPGEVVIDRPSPTDSNWMVIFEAAHHVVFQGFRVAGANRPGHAPSGPKGGIFITGDFARTGKLAHHIAIADVLSQGHRMWGIHSVDSHTVLIQDDVFADSAIEHSAYFSDGSDDYVIRRNVFSGSPQSGLQVNLDPLASLTKVARHAAIDVAPFKPTREWALSVLEAGARRFGPNRFPDGRGFNFLIEDNVITGSGKAGGAAINLAGVRESVIQNNLVYGNLASGIVEWDNDNPFDAAAQSPGPRAPSEVTGADVLPLFGCFNNLVRNNTVLTATRGRPALLLRGGSWGTRARNNILVNDEVPSIEVWNTSIWRLDADFDVQGRVVYEGPAGALKSLALSLPEGGRSVSGLSRSALSSSFVRAGTEPWVVFEQGWWKLNPARPDYHPRAGAPILAGHGDPRDQPKSDLEGRPRAKADIGAYAAR